MAWKKLSPNELRHTCGGPIFGRLASKGECGRCDELRAGKPARKWSGSRKAELERLHIEAIRMHDCKASRCGPVCTFGDY